VPPHPTVRELAGDAWNELSGYDGRIAATFGALLKPGMLTRDYIEGRRARYLSPVRLYLVVSLVYFLVAAAAPSLDAQNGQQTVGPGIRFGVSGAGPDTLMSPEEREQLLAELESAPWVARPLLKAIATDPKAFRANLFTTMPRVFFAMLPLFAAIVSLFYRRETFPTSLVFAVHVHAFSFAALTIAEATKFSGSRTAAGIVGVCALVVVVVYVFIAVRAVFGGSVAATIAKVSGIGVLYLLSSLPTFFIILMWAALS
jgi:hypothetical protein